MTLERVQATARPHLVASRRLRLRRLLDEDRRHGGHRDRVMELVDGLADEHAAKVTTGLLEVND